jgi:autotransporter-associated beta strand protein
MTLLGWLVAMDGLAAPPAGYYLVWSDEFDGSSLDGTKWWTWSGPNRDALNVADAVTVAGGHLTITTYTVNGTHYTAIISSDGKFRYRYGYLEASIQFNTTPGMWSAFWLQSPNEGQYLGDPSASGAEIDICEHRKSDANGLDIGSSVQSTVHWDGYGAYHKQVNSGSIGSGLGSGFHTYGLLWDSTNYRFLIDDTQQWSTNAGHSDRTELVLLSSEVQNNYWAGVVPPGGYGDFLTSTTKMVLDYVRYYAPTTTVFWTGASSADWGSAANWLQNRTPHTGDDVVFSCLSAGNGGTTLAQDTTVGSLSIQEAGPVSVNNRTLTVNSGGIDMLSAVYDTSINSALVLGAAQNWRIAGGRTLTINGLLSGTGNLTLGSRGTVVLAAPNAYGGSITISNGTLLVNSSLTNLVVVTGGALGGTGTIGGPVVVNAGGVLAGSSIASLTFSNSLTLNPGSVTSLNINKAAGTADTIVGLTSLTYGGTLALNNQAGAFAIGDAFKLFDARTYSGAFTTITPASPGIRMGWDTSTLTTDGTLRVKQVPLTQTTNILESRFGNSTSGSSNPAFSFTGFSGTISATKSLAPGCTAPGSSRFSTTAATSTSFSVTPTLVPGITYTVAVTWGHNSSPYQESASLVVTPTATGVSSTTFPATTTAFQSGASDVNNSRWQTIGEITPNTPNPTITFAYASGSLSSSRFYADAVRFVSQIPVPGSISSSRQGNSVILNWLGNFPLQSAANVQGPYTDLPGPVLTGPYTNAISDAQRYFRLRQ